MDPVSLAIRFAVVFVTASLSGLAHLLASNREISRRNVAASLLYYGLVGIAIAAAQFRKGYTQEALMMALVAGVVAGLTGLTAIDAISWLRNRLSGGPTKSGKKKGKAKGKPDDQTV